MGFKSLCIAAMTGDANWTLNSLECGAFPLRYGAERWLSPYRHTVGPDGAVVRGEDCIPFLGQFDAVFLWHWIPEHLLPMIRSSRAIRPKVAFAHAFEAIATTEPWDRVTAPLYAVGKSALLRGTKPNRFGQMYVDAYEASLGGPVGKPHVWMVDIATPVYAQSFVNACEWILDTSYRRHRPDFGFFDSHMLRPYYGTASNAPFIDAPAVFRYKEAWDDLDYAHTRRLMPVWGNGAGLDFQVEYPALGGDYEEHFWRQWTPANAAMALRVHHGMPLVMAGEWVDVAARFPTRESWNQWYETTKGADENVIYMQVARSGSAFGIFNPGDGVVR
jgi:hypothetical protein